MAAKGSAPSTRASNTHGGEPKTESVSKLSAGKDDASGDKLHKRSSPSDDVERMNKRRKGEKGDARDIEFGDGRGDSNRERSMDRMGNDEHSSSMHKASDKAADRSSKDKGGDRYERGEHKERGDEKARDRSMERHHHGRERSVERGGSDRIITLSEKGGKDKDERSSKSSSRYESEKQAPHGQGLPPPPPLPPHVVPQSVAAGGSRRDDDADRRFSTRHSQRLSPRHDERERRQSEENIVSQEDTKRRRDDDLRERKREDRETQLLKVLYYTILYEYTHFLDAYANHSSFFVF